LGNRTRRQIFIVIEHFSLNWAIECFGNV